MFANQTNKPITQRLLQRPVIRKDLSKKENEIKKPNNLPKSHVIEKKIQKRINNENDQGVANTNKDNAVKKLNFKDESAKAKIITVPDDSKINIELNVVTKDDSYLMDKADARYYLNNLNFEPKIEADCDMTALNEFKVDEESEGCSRQIKTQTIKQSFMVTHISDTTTSSNKSEHSLNYTNLMINKANQPTFTTEEYRTALTKSIKKDYGEKLLFSLFEEEESIDDFLKNHKITERMRTRMIDWMIEVLSNYKCDDNSFFIAVNIMDKYFKLTTKMLQPAELHILGITSMFMASKYQDIYPLRLKVIYEKIAHKKITMNEIKAKEQEISSVLNYVIGKPTTFDFVFFYYDEIFYTKHNDFLIKNQQILENCEVFGKKEKIKNLLRNYTPNMLYLLKEVIVYLLKMNCHDYSLSCKKPSLIAASSLFVAMKICEQINKEEYVNEYFTQKLNEISGIPESEMIKVAQKILYNAQNFDSIFANLENLKKVHFNAIIELKNTK